jgi:hypothetical protein
MQNQKYLEHLRKKLREAAIGEVSLGKRESQADLPQQLKRVNREVESITRLPDLQVQVPKNQTICDLWPKSRNTLHSTLSLFKQSEPELTRRSLEQQPVRLRQIEEILRKPDTAKRQDLLWHSVGFKASKQASIASSLGQPYEVKKDQNIMLPVSIRNSVKVASSNLLAGSISDQWNKVSVC